ncbi:hypothetical protein FOZ63_030927, partial [Perkinsus olseni]
YASEVGALVPNCQTLKGIVWESQWDQSCMKDEGDDLGTGWFSVSFPNGLVAYSLSRAAIITTCLVFPHWLSFMLNDPLEVLPTNRTRGRCSPP